MEYLQNQQNCHPEQGRAPVRFLQHGKPESKDLGFVLRRSISLGLRGELVRISALISANPRRKLFFSVTLW